MTAGIGGCGEHRSQAVDIWGTCDYVVFVKPSTVTDQADVVSTALRKQAGRRRSHAASLWLMFNCRFWRTIDA